MSPTLTYDIAKLVCQRSGVSIRNQKRTSTTYRLRCHRLRRTISRNSDIDTPRMALTQAKRQAVCAEFTWMDMHAPQREYRYVGVSILNQDRASTAPYAQRSTDPTIPADDDDTSTVSDEFIKRPETSTRNCCVVVHNDGSDLFHARYSQRSPDT